MPPRPILPPVPFLRRPLLAALLGAGRAAAATTPPATIAFLGDVMLGRDVSATLRTRPPEWFWGDVLPLLRAADAAIANLESPVTEARASQRRTAKWEHFRAEPAAIAILRAAKVRAVSIANNHILDMDEAGLADTRRLLAEARIVAVGAGADAADAAAPAMLDLPGLRIGILAATDALPAYAAGQARPGVNRMEFRPGSPGLAGLAAVAAELRSRGADLLVLSLHWGPNFRQRPFDAARGFAHAALAAGFDVIHGHSAHLLHGVEAVGRGLVLYDTGNAIDDYTPLPLLPQDWGCLFLLDIGPRGPTGLRLVPIRTQPLPMRVATGRDRARILARLRAMSAELGSRLEESAAGLELPL
ncbi:CapA family protein [Roseomonas rosulenta]|uniref:CapA family protein n=1 Tax=Roseomonas rosulenta TaxID=2748667 RepID=UPI0018DFADB8|nr:CapA family protein [Roseomonas rosulenta]